MWRELCLMRIWLGICFLKPRSFSSELKVLIEKIMNHIAAKEQRIRKGVEKMGGKVLEFEHDILMKESEARGKASSLVNSVETIMKTLKVPLEKACELLETTVSDYQKAKLLISK